MRQNEIGQKKKRPCDKIRLEEMRQDREKGEGRRCNETKDMKENKRPEDKRR